MSTFACPKCGGIIPAQDINVGTDVAFCRVCNRASKFSTLLQQTDLTENVDFDRPPAGVHYWQDHRGMKVIASHRSLGIAAGALAVSLFWNGIVSVFVLVALSGTLRVLGITLPDRFPAPKMNGGEMGLGMVIFLWIFLTPFITIGVCMIAAFLMALCGRTEVQIGDADASIFTGIGPLGRRRRFHPATVKSIRVDDRIVHDSEGDSQRQTAIVIETDEGKILKLATMLPQERRKFLAAALMQSLRR